MNLIERLMHEIKRRTSVVGAFPNERACWRIAGEVHLEI